MTRVRSSVAATGGGHRPSPQRALSEQRPDPATSDSPQPPEEEDTPDSVPGSRPPPEGEAYELPLDQVFEILKNSRRRQTLRYLKDNDGATTLSEAAEHIAALENDTTPRAITSAQRKRVYIGLYQCHLPKMDDMNVIDFDQNRGTIELGPNAAQLEPYLDGPAEREWHKLYLSVALGGTVLFVAQQLTGPAMNAVSAVILLGLLAGITLTALAHSVSVNS